MSTSASALQTFGWTDFIHADHVLKRSYYNGFQLQSTQFTVGDAVFLHPEVDGMPPYLGRIVSAFNDNSAQGNDAFCIEVRWFERLQALGRCDTGQVPNEREVIELGETDVNPVGSVAGKATVLCSSSAAEAECLARDISGDWFFCRGVFKQSINLFVPYDAVLGPVPVVGGLSTQPRATLRGCADDADSEDAAMHPARSLKQCSKKRKVSQSSHADRSLEAVKVMQLDLSSPHQGVKARGKGQQCVECGATQTPQWREGPAGPKTLCNACGVRFNRMRSNKKSGHPRPSSYRAKAVKQTAVHESSALTATDSLASSMDKSSAHQSRLGHGRRPMRQAALLSASQTAAFARMGVLRVGDGDEDNEHIENEPVACATGSSGSRDGLPSEDCSHNSEQSTGEMFPESLGHPQATVGALLRQASKSPLLCSIDKESSAMLPNEAATTPTAVYGMMPARCMTPSTESCKRNQQPEQQDVTYLNDCDDTHQDLVNGGSQAWDGDLTPAAADAILRSVACKASEFFPDAAEFQQVFSSFESVRARLPDEATQQLLGMTTEVERAAQDAAAADAALQAVAQVMASRQKAADIAREQAASATERLKARMSELVGQQCLLGRSSLLTGPLGLQDLCDIRVDGPQGMSWSHPLDQENESLLETHLLLGGAADNGAELLSFGCAS